MTMSRLRFALAAMPMVALAVMLAVGFIHGESADGDASRRSASDGVAPQPQEPSCYRTEVIRLDDVIEGLNVRVVNDPRSWLAWQILAASFRQRAQLTGDHLDYTRAGEAVERSFAVAARGAGPFLVRAQLNSSLHRYDLIEADLQAAETDALLDDRAAAIIATLRADCDLYGGRYEQAEHEYRRALAKQMDYQRLFGLANFLFSTGERHQAEVLMSEAERVVPAVDIVGRAWLRLQRGLMDEACGRWDAALARYHAADVAMPGWWMVRARIAGLRALRGDRDGAIADFGELIARNPKPEFADALATLYRATGRASDAEPLVRRARRMYDLMLGESPEAAYGHALDHFLTLENETAITVELAERNRDLRPGGEALTKLAQAYLQAGRLDDARATIASVLSSRWSAAETHALAARVYGACGDQSLAVAEHARAVAIDPHR